MSAEMPMPDRQSIPLGEAIAPSDIAVPRPPSRFLRQLGQGLTVASLALASYLVISHFVLETVQVVGVSMAPTLADSHRYLLNRWVYYLHPPQRQDVVVLRDPTDGTFAVKRVIAVAGDQIYLKDGKIFLNGRKLEEAYLAPGTLTFTARQLKEQRFQCGASQCFVLGDNRNNSVDSRAYGPVSRRDILGLVIR